MRARLRVALLGFWAFLRLDPGEAECAEPQPAQTALPAAKQPVSPLSREVARVMSAYGERGQVHRLKPRLLHRGDTIPVYVPATESRCTTILVLGPSNLSFVLTFGRATRGSEGQLPLWPVASVAGVALVTQCGPRRLALRQVALQMRSPRGVVETIIVHSNEPLDDLRTLLPQRDAGDSAQAPEVGPRPSLGPLMERVAARLEHHQSRGAISVRQLFVEPTDPAPVLSLEAGCHRFDLLAEQDEHRPVDLDARLAEEEDGELVASDESSTADASLALCLGEPARYRLEFRGSPRPSRVSVIHAQFSLPEGIPLQWGPTARARMAAPLIEQQLMALKQSPIEAYLGVQGVTRSSFLLAPRACYAVAVAAIRGQVAQLRLAVQAGPVVREARVPPASDSAGLTFCNETADVATIETQTLGQGVAWLLAIWEVAP